ncbi:MAG: DUF3473 domain-containing protein [Bacteroidetes bacterium]|nr:DUF3473 domain-containing protein [Bacteroidota bacterium]
MLMNLAGKLTQFSGGGHLRTFFPLGRLWLQTKPSTRPPCDGVYPSAEVNPDHPRVEGLSWKKRFTSYHGMKSVVPKLRRMMARHSFVTISECLNQNLEQNFQNHTAG